MFVLEIVILCKNSLLWKKIKVIHPVQSFQISKMTHRVNMIRIFDICSEQEAANNLFCFYSVQNIGISTSVISSSCLKGGVLANLNL